MFSVSVAHLSEPKDSSFHVCPGVDLAIFLDCPESDALDINTIVPPRLGDEISVYGYGTVSFGTQHAISYRALSFFAAAGAPWTIDNASYNLDEMLLTSHSQFKGSLERLPLTAVVLWALFMALCKSSHFRM
jgi:hypothetical protein